jgi:hypothetical protein
LKRIAAALGLAAILAIPVAASVEHFVTPQADLNLLSDTLRTSKDKGQHVIKFSSYGTVGTLKLDTTGAGVDSILITRSTPDSDGVINVGNGTFLDLKRVTVPVTLRGLAFQLGPKGMLIAGSESGKANRNLTIDSCFIYADDLDGTFLSWLGDPTATIEIKNSFFVAKGANAPNTRLAMAAGTILLSNNLFNFPGAITGEKISRKIEIRSNTFNRTQLDLIGQTLSARPTFVINQNLFAHRGPVEAFSRVDYYVASILGFEDLVSTVTVNRMYNSWKGFDVQNVARFNGNTSVDSTYDGKLPTELWDWYTEAKDTTTGLLSGVYKQRRYNVLPGEKSRNLLLGKDTLSVQFRPAIFPRMISLTQNNLGYTLNPAVRLRYAGIGALYFGPFRIDSLIVQKPPVHGKPVLLALGDSGFTIQNSGTSVLDANSRFVNGSLGARYFILGDSANTPSGNGIAVGTGTGLLSSKERAIFAHVDSAGMTRIDVTGNMGIPPEYRYLKEGYTIHTTAKINSTVNFGGDAKLAPYWDRSTTIFWMVKPNTFVPATKGVAPPNVGIYMANAAFNSDLGDWSAYLVEKLTVPGGGKAFTLPGGEGEVQAGAANGYQLSIDSAGVYDTATYGFGTRGYSFDWAGREDADTLSLTLKANPDQDAFVKNGPTIDTVPRKILPDGRFRIAIGKADMGKVFFVATKFNILANEVVNRSIPGGVALSNYTSTTAGRLSFGDVVPAYLDSLNATSDTTFRNTRFLGGKELRASYLKPSRLFGMTFDIAAIHDLSKVEAWSFDGISWAKAKAVPLSALSNSILVDSLPLATQRVLVVEHLLEPEKYVSAGKPVLLGKDILSVRPANVITGDTLKPVTGYCLQLQSVNAAGSVFTTDCLQKPIGEETQVKLEPNSAYKYRILFFMGQEPFIRPYEVLQDVKWDPKATLDSAFAALHRYRWHLLGFPFNDSLKHVVPKVPGDTLEGDAKDETVALRLVTSPDSTFFQDMGNPDKLKVGAGDAYLFASAWNRQIQTGTAEVLPPAPKTVSLKKGWNFIANPFPISFLASRVQSKDPDLLFFELTYDPTIAAPASKYDWDTATTLKAYHGYAVHADTAEDLVFDPFYKPASASVAAAKAGSGSSVGAWLQARIESSMGGAKATLSGNAGQRNVRYLPTPGSSVSMHIGSGAGYRLKTVRDLDRVDEEIEITAPAAGHAAFALTGSEARPGYGSMRLIDLASGRVYDEASASAVALKQGSQAFRLLAGDAGFVEDRTRTFLAGAPAEIGLSQNYPNPFRGRTAVTLDWPAWNGGDRRAVLDVLDMSGRNVARVRLDGIRMGRQALTLDAAGWTPGIYLYRLTVVSPGKRVSLQKRMLVSP